MYPIKKLFILIISLLLVLSNTYASENTDETKPSTKLSNKEYKIYKNAIKSKTYIKNNFKNGDKIVFQIQEILRNLRKNRNLTKIKEIKQKM
jgi:hypothetical protein